MGILSGHAIRAAQRRGEIEITPYDDKLINPNSVDVRLGTRVVTYGHYVGSKSPKLISLAPQVGVLDAKRENPCERHEVDPDGAFILYPGHLYLMHTAEVIRTPCYVPKLDGKSSVARLGVTVHLTAGFGEVGFNGQYTLEVTVVYPTKLYAGMRIAQMYFEELAGDPIDYEKAGGHYVGEYARGAVPSLSWKQFEEDT